MKTKFYFEIETGGDAAKHPRFEGRWANYGTIVAEGNNLDELLKDARVEIMDQDGGELTVVSANEDWMKALIAKQYGKEIGAQ